MQCSKYYTIISKKDYIFNKPIANFGKIFKKSYT